MVWLRNKTARVICIDDKDVLPYRAPGGEPSMGEIDVSEATMAKLNAKPGISTLFERVDVARARERAVSGLPEGLGSALAPSMTTTTTTTTSTPKLADMSEADAVRAINTETNEATLRAWKESGPSGKLSVAIDARLTKIAPPPPKS